MYTQPTPKVEVVSPPAISAIIKPASAGPRIRDRFQAAVLKAIALKMSRSPTISGISAVRAGMDSAMMVPFKKPIAMKCQKVTSPEKMTQAR